MYVELWKLAPVFQIGNEIEKDSQSVKYWLIKMVNVSYWFQYGEKQNHDCHKSGKEFSNLITNSLYGKAMENLKIRVNNSIVNMKD